MIPFESMTISKKANYLLRRYKFLLRIWLVWRKLLICFENIRFWCRSRGETTKAGPPCGSLVQRAWASLGPKILVEHNLSNTISTYTWATYWPLFQPLTPKCCQTLLRDCSCCCGTLLGRFGAQFSARGCGLGLQDLVFVGARAMLPLVFDMRGVLVKPLSGRNKKRKYENMNIPKYFKLMWKWC